MTEAVKRRPRGRPPRPDYVAAVRVGINLIEINGYTAHEAARRAVDIVAWFGSVSVDAPPMVEGPINLHRPGTDTAEGSLLSEMNPRARQALIQWAARANGPHHPPPWPTSYLDARDTVVEQIARKIRRKMREPQP